MTINKRKSVAIIGSLVAVTSGRIASAQWTERTVEVVRTSEVQVLTSGPVHEAFAETVIYDPEPDVVVLQSPPDALDEDPPDQMPDGPNMTWIPGYWAWDDDRDDYLWISGIWRSVPPGRSYVPGFWTRVGHGYQWSAGFWVDADATDIEYLPEPPEPVASGPTPVPPSPNLIWTPGTWVWSYDRYVWRPGQWVEASPDWNWIPAHYIWSPRGYVFVDGYWDYPVERRGVLFAPVYVTPPMRAVRFVYAPTIVIDMDVFTDHLFVRPRYNHYYFGDYYAVAYVDKGYYPWYSVQARRVGYDPIYAQCRWRHRAEPDWERGIEASYYRRRDNERERPPRTLSVQINLENDRTKAAVAGFVVAKTFQQMVQNQNQNQNQKMRFKPVDQAERAVIVQKAQVTNKSRADRKAVEARETDAAAEPVKRTAPMREKLPPATASAKKDSPTSKAPTPKAPEAPQVDRTVEPKAKQKVEKVTRQPATPAAPTSPPPTATPAAPQPAQPTPRPVPATKVEPKPDNKDSGKDKSPDNAKAKPPEKGKNDDKDNEQPKSKTKKKDKDDD